MKNGLQLPILPKQDAERQLQYDIVEVDQLALDEARNEKSVGIFVAVGRAGPAQAIRQLQNKVFQPFLNLSRIAVP